MESKDQNINEEAKRLILEQENSLDDTETSQPKSLGKVKLHDEETTVIEDIGWVRIKLDTLPSQGYFYPKGTEITMRAASVGEIRHWSTIDENDLLMQLDNLHKIKSIQYFDAFDVLHKLTHQHLNIKFYRIETEEILENSYTFSELKQLPVPIVLHNFIEKIGI